MEQYKDEKIYNNDDYKLMNTVFEAAEEYYEAAVAASNNRQYNRPMMICIQLALEEYLQCIIEGLYKKNLEELAVYRNDMANKSRTIKKNFNSHFDLPHNLKTLYRDYIYPKDKSEPKTRIGNEKEIIPYEQIMQAKMDNNAKNLLPKFNSDLSNQLDETFAHYNNIRFAKNRDINPKIMPVTETDIQNSFNLLLDIREITINYKKNIEERENIINQLHQYDDDDIEL
jgi:hypothetical protein